MIFKNTSYKYCITFKKQCPKAKKNGFCSNADKERCIDSKKMFVLSRGWF